MLIFLLIVCFMISLALQTSLGSYVAVYGVKPNLVMVIVLACGMYRGTKLGITSGLIGGLLEDLVSGRTFGLRLIIDGFLGWLTGYLQPKIMPDRLFFPVIITFIGTLLGEIIFLIIAFIFRRVDSFFYPLWQIILPQAVYNAVLAPFLFFLVEKLTGRFERSDKWMKEY